MKKITILSMSIVCVLIVSCNKHIGVPETPPAAPIPSFEPPLVVQKVKGKDTIAFKEHYVSKSQTNLYFTDDKMIRKLSFLNMGPINLEGKIFDENLDVEDNGVAIVKNPSLGGLSTIPALSIWKVDTSKLSVIREKNKLIWVKVVNDRKPENAKYIFYIGLNSTDSTFNFTGKPWKMTHGGNTYEVTSVDKPLALYAVTDTATVRK